VLGWVTIGDFRPISRYIFTLFSATVHFVSGALQISIAIV